MLLLRYIHHRSCIIVSLHSEYNKYVLYDEMQRLQQGLYFKLNSLTCATSGCFADCDVSIKLISQKCGERNKLSRFVCTKLFHSTLWCFSVNENMSPERSFQYAVRCWFCYIWKHLNSQSGVHP